MSAPERAGSGGAGRAVLKNSGALAAARVVDRVATLVLALAIAAHLGASGLGHYSIAMAVYGVIALLGDTGTTIFLMREIARRPDRTGELVVHLSVVAIVVSAAVVAVAIAVVPLLGYPAAIATGVVIATAAVLPRTLNSIQEAAFVAHNRSELEAVTTFAATSVYLVVSLALLAAGHGVNTVLAVFVATEILACGVYFVLLQRFVARLPLRFEWRLARRLLWEIKAFAGSSVLAAALARPEIIVLSLLATPREVGYYGAALRIAEVWAFVPQVFLNSVFPLLSREFGRDEARFDQVQRRAVRAVLAYTLPISAGLLALSPEIIRLAFGSGFGPAADLLRILGLNLTFYALSSVFWRSLAARDRQDLVLGVQAVVAAARVASAVALIALWSATGAALSSAACSLLMLAALVRVTRRTGAHAPSPLVGWRFGVAAAAMAVAAAVAVEWLEVWLVAPLAAVAYAGAVALLRGLAPEDVALLRSLLPARGGGTARPSGGTA